MYNDFTRSSSLPQSSSKVVFQTKEWTPRLDVFFDSLRQWKPTCYTAYSLFVWLVADSWCWFVLREKYCWLVAGGWFVLRESIAGWWLISQANRALEASTHYFTAPHLQNPKTFVPNPHYPNSSQAPRNITSWPKTHHGPQKENRKDITRMSRCFSCLITSFRRRGMREFFKDGSVNLEIFIFFLKCSNMGVKKY
jgi:hypothetical protein